LRNHPTLGFLARAVVNDLARWHSFGLDISACLNLGKSHLKYTDLVKTLTTMDRERNLPARFLAMR
jgi:hypothetical protein